jgi:hypothetical protein
MQLNSQITKNNPGYTQWAAQANQQKSLAQSGKPSTQMQGALMASGGGPAYGQVQNTISNAWKNYQVTPTQYQSEMSAGTPQTQISSVKAAPTTSGGTTGSTASTGGYTGQSTIRPPSYIADALTEDAAQNVLAQGYQAGDKRYQTKSLARPGFSQGKGQEFAGARKAVEAVNKAAGQAADIRSQDQLANSRMRADYEKAREMEAQQQAMTQHALSQSNWARDFAQQSMDAQNQMAYLQAMLQLRLSLMR